MHPDTKLSEPQCIDRLYPFAVTAPVTLNDPGLQKR